MILCLFRTDATNHSQLSMKLFCTKCGAEIDRVPSNYLRPLKAVCFDCKKKRRAAAYIKRKPKLQAEREWRKEIRKIHEKKGLPPARFGAQQSSKPPLSLGTIASSASQ